MGKQKIKQPQNADICDHFSNQMSKYNDDIELTETEISDKVRVYCKEPYAQSLMDKYRGCDFMTGGSQTAKDLEMGQVYMVKPKRVNFDERYLLCEEKNSGAVVYVPVQEYPGDPVGLSRGLAEDFGVMITRLNKGMYQGSNRKYREVDNVNVIGRYYKDKTPFEVVVTEHVRGGYIALFDDTVKCFLPGSHAGANVINDFESMLGHSVPVVVDNFDPANNLYVVSYKKYIDIMMPTRIHELVFGKKYIGRLTSKPTKYGLFVELDGFFTGLVHKSEFKNYKDIESTYSVGDEIEVYVRDVNERDGRYRIVLTLDPENISEDKAMWQSFKDEYVNEEVDFFFDNETNDFYLITKDGGKLNVGMKKTTDFMKNIYKYNKLLIKDVDIVNQSISFDFIKSANTMKL